MPAFKTENAAKDAGNKLLREFWRGPGRPKSIEGEEQKKTDGSDGRERESVGDQRRMIQLGQHPKRANKDSSTAPVKRAPTPADYITPKQKRTNWSKGEHADRLKNVVEQWDGKGPATLDQNGEQLSMRAFANIMSIPFDTFIKYSCEDTSKRRKLGASVGRTRTFSKNQSNLFF